MISSRVWSSATVPNTAVFQTPVLALRTPTTMSGSVGAFSEVFQTATTSPAASPLSALRFMWSSASWSPEDAEPRVHCASESPSRCTAKYMFHVFWLDHMTPILPLKATIEEMSSGLRLVAPVTFGMYGVVHRVSSQP